VSLQIIELFTWKTWIFWYSDSCWHDETCSLNPLQTKLTPVRYRLWCWWIFGTFLCLMLGTLGCYQSFDCRLTFWVYIKWTRLGQQMEKYTLQGIGVAHLSSGWDSVEPVANKGWRQLLQGIKMETVNL